jgi:threonine/homoserine/homoserine lactone efflux protein
MGQAIGEVLPPAIGVALSPFPIIAVILMLFSPKAKTNGPAFLVGWAGGIVVVAGLVLLLASPDDVSGEGDEPATWASLIQLVLGLGLLFLTYQNWQKRPKEGETPEMPTWMASIDKTPPLVALGLGAMLSGVNPKNLIFNVAAGTAIAQADLSTGEALVPFVVYVVVASVSVAVPVIWYLAAQQSAAKTLEEWKTWLTANNAVVMAVLLLVLGVKLSGQGLGGLID